MSNKYKHALFLNPYMAESSSTNMSMFPPTGLEYVATSAEGLADRVSLCDLRYNEKFNNAEKLNDFIKKEVDIICATVTWNRDFDKVCELLNLLPEDKPLVVGGYKATEEVEEIFKRCPTVDVIVRGEGEETIKDIMKGAAPEDTPGISYRRNDEIVHNKNRPLPDINTIAAPDRKLRQNSYYIKANGVRTTNATFDTILSSRGCIFNCKFCTFNLNPLGQKRTYAARSAESVISEIEGIRANIILFSDDNFCTEPKRAEEICDLIISRGIKKRFVAQARIDIAKYPAVLKKMVKAGFKMLLVGIESPHDYILKEYNKGFNQKMIREYFKVLTKYPIFYHGNYIYGNMGETEEEMMYIAKFSKEIGLDSVAFSKLRVDKYSPLREVVKNTPGYHLTQKGELYSDKYSHSDLKKIHRKLKFAFYTPDTILKIGWKFARVGFFNFKDIISFLFYGPLLLIGVIKREIHKKRLKDSLKRIFVKNI